MVSRFTNSRTKRILSWSLIAISTLIFLAFVPLFGYFQFRRQSKPALQDESYPLFQGVHYQKSIDERPRRTVWHFVRIDVDAPGLKLIVTPRDQASSMDTLARTTSQFLTEFDVQLAINGSFFQPCHTKSVLEYYPKVMDPVDVFGRCVAHGELYSNDHPEWPVLTVSENGVSIGNEMPTDVQSALAGRDLIIDNGQVLDRRDGSYNSHLQPRTAVAVNRSQDTLWMIVVDGRQPNYSAGVTLRELGQKMVQLGAWKGLNLDGGGSSTLAVEENGRARVLNAPYHTRFPMRERPVGNHLGVYARTLEADE